MIKRTVLRIFIIRLVLEILLSVVSIETPIDKETIVTSDNSIVGAILNK